MKLHNSKTIEQSIRVTNCIDVRQQESTESNKGYIVDNKLIQILMRKTAVADINEVKRQFNRIINSTTTIDDLFEEVEDYIYMSRVATAIAFTDDNQTT